ncbi:hypothetical protein AtEden1_Chr3g0190911 [Arabidopsis thaliana]
MNLAWLSSSFSKTLVARLSRLVRLLHCLSLFLNRLKLISLWKCLRALLSRSDAKPSLDSIRGSLPNPKHLAFRVKKFGIMTRSLRSRCYQSLFISLLTLSSIIEFSHVLIYCLDNLLSSGRWGKYGIMTMSSRGGYRLFLNLVNPLASSMEHLFKRSDALFARVTFDHNVVEDFAKPAFMVESAKASTDFSIIGKLMKLLSLFYCIILISLYELPSLEV